MGLEINLCAKDRGKLLMDTVIFLTKEVKITEVGPEIFIIRIVILTAIPLTEVTPKMIPA